MPQVNRTKSPQKALESLMRLCARAEKSSGDALRLMRGWGVDRDEATKVLEQLIKERFIDDSRYANAFVREKINLTGWGVYKIKTALFNKGIAKDIVSEALSQFTSQHIDSRLGQELKKRVVKLKGTPYEIRTKLIRYGASLGYDFDTVVDWVDRVIAEP